MTARCSARPTLSVNLWQTVPFRYSQRAQLLEEKWFSPQLHVDSCRQSRHAHGSGQQLAMCTEATGTQNMCQDSENPTITPVEVLTVVKVKVEKVNISVKLHRCLGLQQKYASMMFKVKRLDFIFHFNFFILTLWGFIHKYPKPTTVPPSHFLTNSLFECHLLLQFYMVSKEPNPQDCI